MCKAHLYHVALPMTHAFSHARAERKLAESIIFSIEEAEIKGIGECVPRTYVTGESIHSVMEDLKQLSMDHLMTSLDLSNLDTAIDSFNHINLFNDTASHLNTRCVIETAILDLIGKKFQISLSEILTRYYLPKEIQNSSLIEVIPTTQVMDFSLTPEEFLKTRGPFHHVKVKLGNNLVENVERIKAVRKGVGYGALLTVDANMVWSFQEAIKNIYALNPYAISYYEEPLKKGDLITYSVLQKEFGIKILLDESLCSVQDAISAISLNACAAFNIRISKCGGLRNAIEIIKLAYQHNIEFQIGAQVAETGPLIAAGRHLASAVNHYFTFEGGQPDRHFDPHYIVSPMPLVDRKTNLAFPLEGPGLGIHLNDNLHSFVKQTSTWHQGHWN